MSIRKVSITSAYPLAEVMHDQGYRLLPKKDTPLADLVKCSYGNSDTMDINEIAENVSKITTFPINPNSQNGTDVISIEEMIDSGLSTVHSTIMDDLVDKVSYSVRKHINFARNVVKPLVTDFCEKLKSSLTNFDLNNNPASKFKIVDMRLPNLVNDVEFMEQFDRYENKTYTLTDGDYIPVSDLDDSALLSLLHHDVDSIKDSLVSSVTMLPDYFLMNLWNGFFNPTDKPYSITLDKFRNLNVYEKFYASLFLYVIATNLIDNPLESIKGISYDELKEKLQTLKDFAGSNIYITYDIIQSYISTGIMVLHINATTKTAILVGEVYDVWIKENNPEVILGMIVDDSNIKLVSEIDKDKDKFIRDWNLYYNFSLSDNSVRTIGLIKSLITEVFFLELSKDCSEYETEYRNRHTEYSEIVKYKLNQLVDGITVKSISDDDIYLLSLKAVAQCRFYYTAASNILLSMYNSLQDNKNLDVGDAALIATIDYLGLYLANQIKKSA